MSATLPCPHCGGTDIRFNRHLDYRSPTSWIWSICCYQCGATFPNRYQKELLLEAWNTRVLTQGSVGCGAKVEEIEATIRIEFNHSEDGAGVRRAAERVWTFLEARAKTLARQTTTSVLPLREGQAEECDGGLHSAHPTQESRS